MNNLKKVGMQFFYNSRYLETTAPKVSFYNFHTAFISRQNQPPTTEPPTSEKKYKKPVDWLPFTWQRRPRFNVINSSGDTITELTVDSSLPKPDFELSEELKTATEAVKHKFSLATAKKDELKEVYRRQLLKRVQRHPHDFSSLEVKIALKTLQIICNFEHRRTCSRKDVYNTKVKFPILVQKRNKMLTNLFYLDEERYEWILNELQLKHQPAPMGMLNLERYCKKWDLRRLTKEHCAKVVADKKAAYHVELKKQQKAFLEEKKETLAWIEEEEKALEALSV